MFEKLYVDQSTIDRYRSAPLLELRVRFLEHVEQTGVKPDTLCSIAQQQLRLLRLMELRADTQVDLAQVEAAVQQPSSTPRSARCDLVNLAVRWLRFAGLFKESVQSPQRHRYTHEVETFADWMRHGRGLSKQTIDGSCRVADVFCEQLERQAIALESIGFGEIERQIASWQGRGLRRRSVQDYVQNLRTFLRFAADRGWCPVELADGIVLPRLYPDETIPKGLSQDEIARVLATADGDRPTDIRDRAMLMLLAQYGLRAGELVGLTLDDINWAEDTLRVRRPKTGHTDRYPLSGSVGRAIVRYLCEVRPPDPQRSLFLTVLPPVRPLSAIGLHRAVKGRIKRAGIACERYGPHAFRHGVAQHLLDQGLSMKTVGDYLGHHRLSTTAIYAKVQLSALREVAEIDLEGLA